MRLERLAYGQGFLPDDELSLVLVIESMLSLAGQYICGAESNIPGHR